MVWVVLFARKMPNTKSVITFTPQTIVSVPFMWSCRICYTETSVAFQEYASFPAKAIAMDSDLRVIDNSAGLPWHNYVSVLGMVGQTAYVGYKALAKAKKAGRPTH